jgi:O-antigen/teichoic acid export membrane protein
MKVKENNFLQDSSILFILNMTASALNYLCQLLLARILSVDAFGTINTAFSFMLIIAVPGTTLTMIVAKYYAGMDNDVTGTEKRSYIRTQLRAVSVLALFVMLLLIIFGNPLGKLLAIDDKIVILSAFVLAALGFYQPLYSGVFSGNGKFILVGVYSLLIPLYKIISIGVAYFLTIDAQERLYVVMWVMIIGTIITIFVGHWRTTAILGRISKRDKHEFGSVWGREDINIFVLNINLMIYMNIDLLSVRYHGYGDESGLYSSALLFGRIIYYFSTTLGTILLPSVAGNEISERGKIKTLNKALLMMMGFALVCIIPVNLCSEFFIRLLYGEEYLQAALYIKYISLISVALSISTILVNYLVGIGKTKFATIIMVATNFLIIILTIFNNNIDTILTGIGIVGMAASLILYFSGINAHKKLNVR